MPENPLLPNRQLQQLYATMLRARESSSGRSKGLEAIFATVAQQLEAGDAVVPMSHDTALEALLRPAQFPRLIKRAAASASRASLVPSSPHPLAFAEGLAAAAQLSGQSRLAAVLLDPSRPEPALASLLDHAQRNCLPLVVICPETSGKAPAQADALTWDTLNRIVKKLRFPVLTVDGGDAVAMYRAMQESVLRARQGDGPALLWCLMPQAASRGKGEQDPLLRLERYMAARKISLPRASAR